jgi:hypothetical protein
MQASALTVRISRLIESSVEQARTVLLKSEARLGLAFTTWPLLLRRRISAQFWRAQGDEKEREMTQKGARRHQSNKNRRSRCARC